ncbi:hypothetical protein ACIGW0_23270 [Streptomyces bikiniensis]|uniref:YdhG-like domain-containing protein n=1 Tax=Streptomyces bikiniensis TaxID=1896 RepID=A0ABW8D136_STRBI
MLAKIAAMPGADWGLAGRIHGIVGIAAPVLAPELWYGMPAYAGDGKVVLPFQSAEKLTSWYATLGFSDQAALDEGAMRPTAYVLKEPIAADEQLVSALVRDAAG